MVGADKCLESSCLNNFEINNQTRYFFFANWDPNKDAKLSVLISDNMEDAEEGGNPFIEHGIKRYLGVLIPFASLISYIAF